MWPKLTLGFWYMVQGWHSIWWLLGMVAIWKKKKEKSGRKIYMQGGRGNVLLNQTLFHFAKIENYRATSILLCCYVAMLTYSHSSCKLWFRDGSLRLCFLLLVRLGAIDNVLSSIKVMKPKIAVVVEHEANCFGNGPLIIIAICFLTWAIVLHLLHSCNCKIGVYSIQSFKVTFFILYLSQSTLPSFQINCSV